MINKYAELNDRILLYNACKGILRVKMAEGMPAGAVSSMNYNAGTGQQPQAPGQQQQFNSPDEAFMNDEWYNGFKQFARNYADGKASKEEIERYKAQTSPKTFQAITQMKNMRQTPLIGKWRMSDSRMDDLFNVMDSRRSQAIAKYNQQQQQQPMQQQMYQQPMQQQTQQQAPQGVDQNTWQQFQRWQQMMAQPHTPQGNSVLNNVQKNPLGTGLGMV